MSPLPHGQEERRQDCIDHEKRLDDIGAEIHKHSGWWKVIGGGLVASCSILLWFGTAIDGKLSSIQTLLSDSKVTMMQHSEQIKALQKDINVAQERLQWLEQGDHASVSSVRR